MSVTVVDPVSNSMGGPYDVGLDTIYDFALEPQIMGELIKLYGKGIGLHEILTFAGNTMDIASHVYEVHSEGSILNYVTINTAIAAGIAGATVAVVVTDSADDEQLLQANDVVLLPAEYINAGASTSPAKYQVTTVTAGAGETTYTCTPLLSTYQVTTEIPADTALMVTLGNYAPGTNGGNWKHVGWYQDYFYTAIKKAAFALGGSTQSTKRYQDTMKNGQTGMWTKASLEADFRLSAAISDELLIGVVPDSSSTVTQEDFNGTDRIVRGTKGLWPHLVDDGMLQEYVEDYAISDLDDVSDAFESQGVLSKFATFCQGSSLYRGFENSGLEFITEFSGGTDLMKEMGNMGIEFRRVKKNGIDFAIVKLDTFSNPFTYGLSTYNWKKYGFIVPSEYTMVKQVNGSNTVELANLMLAYKNYNGENRRRVLGLQPGMTGRNANGSITTRWDADAAEFLSEFALVATKVNQMIRVEPQA